MKSRIQSSNGGFEKTPINLHRASSQRLFRKIPVHHLFEKIPMFNYNQTRVSENFSMIKKESVLDQKLSKGHNDFNVSKIENYNSRPNHLPKTEKSLIGYKIKKSKHKIKPDEHLSMPDIKKSRIKYIQKSKESSPCKDQTLFELSSLVENKILQDNTSSEDSGSVSDNNSCTDDEEVIVISDAEDSDHSNECMMDTFVAHGDRCHKVVCRNIRVGSYKTVPTAAVLLCVKGVRIPLKTLQDDEIDINIDLDEILKILYHLGRQLPVFFLYVKPDCAARVRRKLCMINKSGVYFDSTSSNESVKRIVMIPEKVNNDDMHTFINRSYGNLLTSEGVPKVEEITLEEANVILVSASPKEVQAVVKNAPRITPQLTESSKTLLIYPPPPMSKGGISITVDDYQVLEEESFLNDVIIDFYLKWLLQNKVPSDICNKVHIFSTFFYKRLTSKPKKSRRHHPTEDDPKLSKAEKRHARVKSWTKNIDIFEKDFVVVPINEHAHWFLAIICFPGLAGPVSMLSGDQVDVEQPAQPLRRKRNRARTEQIPVIDDCEWSDRDEASGDEDELLENDESDDETRGNEEPKAKKNRSDNSPIIPGLGGDEPSPPLKQQGPRVPIKQPCILIFDSLSGGQRASIVATLRDYLSIEYRNKKQQERKFDKENMKGACPRVPQQTNYSDCGIYILQFTETFFEKPLQDYQFPMRGMTHWFDQAIVAGKREAIALLIKRLMFEYNPNNNIQLPEIYFNTAEEREKGGRASVSIEIEREKAERLNQDSKKVASEKEELCGEKIPGLSDDIPSAPSPGKTIVSAKLANAVNVKNTTKKAASKKAGKVVIPIIKALEENRKVLKNTNANLAPNIASLSSNAANLSNNTANLVEMTPLSVGNNTHNNVANDVARRISLGAIPTKKPFSTTASNLLESGKNPSPPPKKTLNAPVAHVASNALRNISAAYSDEGEDSFPAAKSLNKVDLPKSIASNSILNHSLTKASIPKLSANNQIKDAKEEPAVLISDSNMKILNDLIKNEQPENSASLNGVSKNNDLKAGDKSEVYVFVDQSEQPTIEFQRAKSNSPDIYGDLDEEDDEENRLGDMGADIDDASMNGLKNGVNPAVFKFNSRGTSSGRTIAPPKRYLDHESPIKKKKHLLNRSVNPR